MDQDSPIKDFEDFLKYIKFWEPPCIVIDWNDIEIGKNLGRGSYGTVSQVKVPSFSKDLAIKIVPSINWNDFDDVQRLIREIQILHSCDHPNILPLYGLAINKQTNPIQIGILTPLKWGSLAHLLQLAFHGQATKESLPKGTVFDNETKQKLIFGISAGLFYLSSKNIIHRDIKLENILLDENLNPLISDFGFAKQTVLKSGALQSEALGTLVYAAPEIAMGKEMNEKVDIYSWSIVINSILQEEVPSIEYIRESSTIMKTVMKPDLIEGDEYKLYRELIERARMNDPKERPSAQEIVDRLMRKEAMLSDVDQKKIQEYQKEVLSSIPKASLLLFQRLNALENENEKLIKYQKESIPNQMKTVSNNDWWNFFIQFKQSQFEVFESEFANDPDHKKDRKFTPLHYAVKINNKKIVLYLISKGADINAKDIIYQIIIILFLIKII